MEVDDVFLCIRYVIDLQKNKKSMRLCIGQTNKYIKYEGKYFCIPADKYQKLRDNVFSYVYSEHELDRIKRHNQY